MAWQSIHVSLEKKIALGLPKSKVTLKPFWFFPALQYKKNVSGHFRNTMHPTLKTKGTHFWQSSCFPLFQNIISEKFQCLAHPKACAEVSRFDGAKATHFRSFVSLCNGDEAAVFSHCSKHALTQASDNVRERQCCLEQERPLSLVGPLTPWSEVGQHLQHESPWELVRNVEFAAPPPTC